MICECVLCGTPTETRRWAGECCSQNTGGFSRIRSSAPFQADQVTIKTKLCYFILLYMYNLYIYCFFLLLLLLNTLIDWLNYQFVWISCGFVLLLSICCITCCRLVVQQVCANACMLYLAQLGWGGRGRKFSLPLGLKSTSWIWGHFPQFPQIHFSTPLARGLLVTSMKGH